MWLSQKSYLEQILIHLGADNLTPCQTPMEAGLDLRKPTSDYVATKDKIRKFQTAIGSLMYAAIVTRPDLAFAVNKLSQFASNPDDSHFAALKRLFRYVAGTVDLALRYDGDGSHPILNGWSDADWAGDKVDRKSQGAYTFFSNNCLISWSSKKQPTVALSSCEAEYMALTQSTKEAVWLQQLMADVGQQQSGPTTICGDNKGSLALAHDPAFHARVKHIDIQHHFIREKVEDNIVEVKFVPSNEMVADGLTKALPRPAFEQFINLLNMDNRWMKKATENND